MADCDQGENRGRFRMRQDRYSHRRLTPHYIAPMLGAHPAVHTDTARQDRAAPVTSTLDVSIVVTQLSDL